jgi:hypothetical protein
MHCPHKDEPPPQADAGSVAAHEPSAYAVAIDGAPEVCTLGHLGVLLDLPTKQSITEAEAVEREGASWARITGSKLVLRFAGPTDLPKDPIAVDVRARGLAAKRMTFTLNGKLLGDVTLSRNEVKTLHGSSTQGAVMLPANELVIRFGGLPRQSNEPSAEIDWIHVGTAEEGAAYVAPTHADALGTHTIGGVPRRGFSVRGPGYLRCSGVLPEHGTLEAQLGILGDGEADVEARVLRDRSAPMVLGRAHVRAGETWKAMTFGVDLPSRSLGAFELAVMQPTPGARVVLAEPRLGTKNPPKPPAAASAKNAVLVILGSLPARSIAPYGGPIAMPELGALADAGARYEAHRAASTWPAASVASMFTGLSPRAHGVGERSGLDASIVTVADAAKQGGVTTAFFTANPTTSADYGFSRPFSTFLAAMPGSGPSTGVIDEAARFFRDRSSARLLLVVHARGAHPPWDPSAESLKKLPPKDYTGPIDPQHAGEILARAKRSPRGIRLNDADRTRASALQGDAIERHDAALGKLLAAIRETGHESDTLVIVTSDVGLGDKAFLSDADPLEETELAIPLIVRGPGFEPRSRVDTPTTSADVAPTLLEALGLDPPSSFGGTSVRRLEPSPRALLSSLGDRWSLRLLGFVLHGDDHAQHLCDLLADPSCSSDAEPQAPLAMEILRRVDLGPRRAVEPAYPSAATVNALRVWGR